jgi:hypothetical protein
MKRKEWMYTLTGEGAMEVRYQQYQRELQTKISLTVLRQTSWDCWYDATKPDDVNYWSDEVVATDREIAETEQRIKRLRDLLSSEGSVMTDDEFELEYRSLESGAVGLSEVSGGRP